jgi:hypothetical protein
MQLGVTGARESDAQVAQGKPAMWSIDEVEEIAEPTAGAQRRRQRQRRKESEDQTESGILQALGHYGRWLMACSLCLMARGLWRMARMSRAIRP